MTEPLSSAAQVVLNAATSVCHPETEIVAFQCTRLEVAAALRVAADQVVPENLREYENYTNEAIRLNRMHIRAELLAIAAELEADNG